MRLLEWYFLILFWALPHLTIARFIWHADQVGHQVEEFRAQTTSFKLRKIYCPTWLPLFYNLAISRCNLPIYLSTGGHTFSSFENIAASLAILRDDSFYEDVKPFWV